jgi:hypothetical protein
LRRRKQIIQWILAGVLVVDLVLVLVNWKLSSAPRAAASQLVLLKREHDLMAADIARGDEIRRELPAVEQQGDAFFKEHLHEAGSGYSALVDNLGVLERDAGLRAENVTYHQGPPDKRGVVEIQIGETIEGDYPSVVRFINGLEHADNFYVLDSLTLAADSAGELKLNLQLKTYFRT